jgi:hypothetical protein
MARSKKKTMVAVPASKRLLRNERRRNNRYGGQHGGGRRPAQNARDDCRELGHQQDYPAVAIPGFQFPASWGKAPTEHMKFIMANYAHKTAPKDGYTWWYQIFEPIEIAAAHMELEEQMWEVALPISEATIKAWGNNKEATNFKPPAARSNTDNMQRPIYDEMGRLYNLVTEDITRRGGPQFRAWSEVLAEWSSCAQFFSTYWYLNSHLSKEQAFRNAKEIGQKRIRKKSDVVEVKNALIEEARNACHRFKVNNLLTCGVKRCKVFPTDTHCTNKSFLMFRDELEAQAILTAYFNAKNVKTGSFKDKLAFAKSWIKAEKASEDDQDLFSNIMSIYTAKEVEKGRKRNSRTSSTTTKKRSRAEIVAYNLSCSNQPVSDEIKLFWQTRFDLDEFELQEGDSLEGNEDQPGNDGGIGRPEADIQGEGDGEGALDREGALGQRDNPAELPEDGPSKKMTVRPLNVLVEHQRTARMWLFNRRKRAKYPQDVFRPWSQLVFIWDGNWRTEKTKPTVASGGFVWKIPDNPPNSNEVWRVTNLLQYLFANENDFLAKIPSLKDVDDSIDNGNLRKAVGQCKEMLSKIKVPGERLKCRQVCKLKELINRAWKREAEYRTAEALKTEKLCHVCETLVPAAELALCKRCFRTIHVDCGYCYDATKINCAPCCVAQGTNPPALEHHHIPLTVAGERWCKLQNERYIMIVNFVNYMIMKGAVDFNPADDQNGSLVLTKEACDVLMATGMQERAWMGNATTKQFLEGVKTWLPTFFHPMCGGYLAAFYRVSTTIREDQSVKPSTVLKLYFSKDVQNLVGEMMEEVVEYAKEQR